MYAKAFQAGYRSVRQPLQKRLAMRVPLLPQNTNKLVAPIIGTSRTLQQTARPSELSSPSTISRANIRQVHITQMTTITLPLLRTLQRQSLRSLRSDMISSLGILILCALAYGGLFVGALLLCMAVLLDFFAEQCIGGIVYLTKLSVKLIKCTIESIREVVACIAKLLKGPLGQLEVCIVDDTNKKWFYVEGHSQGLMLARQAMKQSKIAVEPGQEDKYMLGWLQSIIDYAEGKPSRKTAAVWFWKNADPYEQGYKDGKSGKRQADRPVFWYTWCFKFQPSNWNFDNGNGLSGDDVYITAFKQGVVDGSQYAYRMQSQSR